MLRSIGNNTLTPFHRELLGPVGIGPQEVDCADRVTRIEAAGQRHTQRHVAASGDITTAFIADATSGESLSRGRKCGAFKPRTSTFKHKLIRLVQGIGGLTSLPIREGAVTAVPSGTYTDPATSELTSLPLALLLIKVAH